MLKFLLPLIIVAVPFHGALASSSSQKILIVLNQGYRPEEYFEPRKLFDEAGLQVTVAAREVGSVLPSKKHISEVPPVPATVAFDHVVAKDYDAIVFVGGNGAWNDLLPNPNVHKILLDSVKSGKITALICAATGLLATAGNLDGDHPQFQGRHVTGYFEVEGILKKVGLVNYDGGAVGLPYVVTDGKLITGRDPSSAKLFGKSVIAALKSVEKKGNVIK
jgi:protease I